MSTFDELLPHSQYPSAAAYAMETARHKALEVAQRLPHADLVIGADTVRAQRGRPGAGSCSSESLSSGIYRR